MKALSRYLIAGALALLARLVIRKYRPTIVMVTGSVGKTLTKDAIAAALGTNSFVRKSDKSYNSEFGVPLTILGASNPWLNLFSWISVFKEAFALILLPNHYPKILVLEVGADRPGDLSRILRIACPDVVVVTRLPEIPVHVEAYANPRAVREEEFASAYALAPGSPLIISADDPYAMEMASQLDVKVCTFGTSESANVRITDAALFLERGKPIGMQAELATHTKHQHVVVRGAVGEQQLLPAAAALATALVLDIPFNSAIEGLATYEPPPGRGRLLEGMKGSLLIDDSYNASPVAVEEALKALSLLRGRHIAVLADMLELGRYSVTEHERIGALAGEKADIVVAVGIRARALAASARAARGAADDGTILAFDTPRDAIEPLRALVSHGDAVLIKGSQSMRMERIVDALLADPLDAAKLVRQEKEWKRKL